MVGSPNVSARPGGPGVAWRLFGSTRLRRSPTMKNFARLVRFAWPYRVRFGLSLACAVMVALLWCANISAVLPLLKILFYSENCQKWVAEQIASRQTEVRAIAARMEEVDLIRKTADPTGPSLRDHFQAIHEVREVKDRKIRGIESARDFALAPVKVKGIAHDPDSLES